MQWNGVHGLQVEITGRQATADWLGRSGVQSQAGIVQGRGWRARREAMRVWRETRAKDKKHRLGAGERGRDGLKF